MSSREPARRITGPAAIGLLLALLAMTACARHTPPAAFPGETPNSPSPRSTEGSGIAGTPSAGQSSPPGAAVASGGGETIHVAGKGETLSLLAERYYGDSSKYSLIARYNGLPDPGVIEEGQRIRIPPLEGIAAHDAAAVRTMLLRARSLLDTGAWDACADIAARVRVADPTNPQAREIFLEATYRRGVGWFEGGIFDKAIASFDRLLLVDADYRDAIELREQAKRKLARLVDRLYKEGILLYREKRLDEAVDKWNEVLRLDSAHEETRKFREKALQLQEKLRKMDME